MQNEKIASYDYTKVSLGHLRARITKKTTFKNTKFFEETLTVHKYNKSVELPNKIKEKNTVVQIVNELFPTSPIVEIPCNFAV